MILLNEWKFAFGQFPLDDSPPMWKPQNYYRKYIVFVTMQKFFLERERMLNCSSQPKPKLFVHRQSCQKRITASWAIIIFKHSGHVVKQVVSGEFCFKGKYAIINHIIDLLLIRTLKIITALKLVDWTSGQTTTLNLH